MGILTTTTYCIPASHDGRIMVVEKTALTAALQAETTKAESLASWSKSPARSKKPVLHESERLAHVTATSNSWLSRASCPAARTVRHDDGARGRL